MKHHFEMYRTQSDSGIGHGIQPGTRTERTAVVDCGCTGDV